MIMNRTLERIGAAPSNFVQRLVGPDFELAHQVAKGPYNFGFLGLSGEVVERDLEMPLRVGFPKHPGNWVRGARS